MTVVPRSGRVEGTAVIEPVPSSRGRSGLSGGTAGRVIYLHAMGASRELAGPATRGGIRDDDEPPLDPRPGGRADDRDHGDVRTAAASQRAPGWPAAPPRGSARAHRLRVVRDPGAAAADLGCRARLPPATAAVARRQHLCRHEGHGRDAEEVRQAGRDAGLPGDPRGLPDPRHLGRPRPGRQRRRQRLSQEGRVAEDLPRLLRRPGRLAPAEPSRRLRRARRRPRGEAGPGDPARHPLLPQQPADEEPPGPDQLRAVRREARTRTRRSSARTSGAGWPSSSRSRPRSAWSSRASRSWPRTTAGRSG